MATEIKRADDRVRIVNITGEDGTPAEELRMMYDAQNYDFAIKEEKVIQRNIAEHLRTKAHIFGQQNMPGRHRLKIIELPAGQRQLSAGVSPALVKENDSLQKSLDEKDAEIADLRRQLKKK